MYSKWSVTDSRLNFSEYSTDLIDSDVSSEEYLLQATEYHINQVFIEPFMPWNPGLYEFLGYITKNNLSQCGCLDVVVSCVGFLPLLYSLPRCHWLSLLGMTFS